MYIYFSSPVFLSPHFLEKKGEGFLYCVKHQPGGIRSHSCSWHNAVLISARCPAKQGWPSQGHLLCKKGPHLIFPSPPQNLSFFRQCFQRGCQGWILQYLFSTLKPLLRAWAATEFMWQRQLIHLWPNLEQDLTQCSLNTKHCNWSFQDKMLALTQTTGWTDQMISWISYFCHHQRPAHLSLQLKIQSRITRTTFWLTKTICTFETTQIWLEPGFTQKFRKLTYMANKSSFLHCFLMGNLVEIKPWFLKTM